MNTKLFLTALTLAALSACGGSDDNAAAPAPVAPTTTIQGTAAVGAALANAAVQARCANGTGTATTGADGRFSIQISGATRPCVLSVQTPDGTMLHSVVEPGDGTAANANITPLTELITAALAQGDTAAFFAQFDPTAQGRVTPANVDSASQTVQLVLSGIVELEGFDAVKGALVAANGAQAGNALDQKLDELSAVLKKSKTSIRELSLAFGANAGRAAIATVLQPASESCAGLRSGSYTFANILPGSPAIAISLDASTLMVTPVFPPEVPVPSPLPTISLTANAEACSFDFIGATLLMSKSGIGMLTSSDPAIPLPPMYVLPTQEIALSELAGNWVGLGIGFVVNAFPATTSRATMTIDATGKVTAGVECTTAGVCTPWAQPDLPTLAKTASGFTLTTAKGTANIYAFKGTDGQVMMVVTHSDGFMFASQQKQLALPTLGSKQAHWNTGLGLLGGASMFESVSTTVTGVDAAAGTYTQQRDDGRVDTFGLNTPVAGLRHIHASAIVAEALALDFGNTGVSANVGIESGKEYFGASILRP